MNDKQFKAVRDNMIWIVNWYGLGVCVLPAEDVGGAKDRWRAICAKKRTQRYPTARFLARAEHKDKNTAIRMAIVAALAAVATDGASDNAILREYLLAIQRMIGLPN